MSERKIYIGTSGWMYKHWGERYYPKDLKEDHLTFFAREFETVEINSSFYRMPNARTFEAWNKKTPRYFIFAVKLNQFITHRKRLIVDDESKEFLNAFLKNTQLLEKKLAVILIQLPPSAKQNLERLEIFLNYYNQLVKKLKYKPISVMEFRHVTWFNEATYKILKKHKIGFVISSTPDLRRNIFTADFTYIRMHGGEKHESRYLKRDLEKMKEEIDKFPQNVKKVFVYFNNDYSAYAIENTRYLISLFESK